MMIFDRVGWGQGRVAVGRSSRSGAAWSQIRWMGAVRGQTGGPDGGRGTGGKMVGVRAR